MNTPEIASIALTCAATIAAFHVNGNSKWSVHAWLGIAFAALLAATISGFINAIGVAAIAGLGLTAWFVHRDGSVLRQRIAFFVLILFSLVLGFRLLPGFNNPRLIDPQLISLDSTVFALYANFEKAWIGAIVIVFLYSLPAKCRLGARESWQASPLKIIVVSALTIIIIITMSMAVAMGVVRVDAKLPDFFPMAIVIHLFFTVIPEEAFFRLLVQAPISQRLASVRLVGGELALSAYWILSPILSMIGPRLAR